MFPFWRSWGFLLSMTVCVALAGFCIARRVPSWSFMLVAVSASLEVVTEAGS